MILERAQEDQWWESWHETETVGIRVRPSSKWSYHVVSAQNKPTAQAYEVPSGGRAANC